MFELALLNPLRFIDTANINFGFDGNFAVEQVFSYQNPKCYLQKWQHTDVLKLQLLSSDEPSDMQIINIDTGLVAKTLIWQEQSTNIVGYDLSVYEIAMLFTELPDGKYYARQLYTDENATVHELLSEPFFVADVQENTTLLRYKNSENDFDVIFDTNIEFQFRVEGAVKNYMPGTNRTVFTDQMVNPTLVSAMPYRKFKFFIGYGQGVPDWVFDKVTHILAVNEIKFNGIGYQVSEGAEYEAERNDDNNYMGGSIDVQPTDNKFNRFETIPDDETTSFVPMQKVLKYFNQSGNLVISGVFKNFSLLEKICISKRSADFLLNVGTTSGGHEIAQDLNVNNDENTFTIEELFNMPETIYLSGLAAADVDILVVYKQLDEPPITTLPSTTTPEGICSAKVYVELHDGDMERDWNMATGLGNSNTNWKGWAWMDGRNGTPNWANRTPVMTDDIEDIGTFIGSNSITLTKAQLPNVGINLLTQTVGGAGGDTPNATSPLARARNVSSGGSGLNYEIVKGSGTPDIGLSAPLGQGQSINNTPLRVKALWVMKIDD